MAAEIVGPLLALVGAVCGWVFVPWIVARLPERSPADRPESDHPSEASVAAAEDVARAAPADQGQDEIDHPRGPRWATAGAQRWPTYAEVAATPGARPRLAITTSLTWLLLGSAFPERAFLPALLWLSLISVALAWVDLRTHKLPDLLNVAAFAGTAMLLAPVVGTSDGSLADFGRALLAAAALFAFFLALALLYPAGMGLGDVKLAGALGFALGWFGWPEVVFGAFLAFLLGSVVGLTGVLLRRVTMRSAVPFGPAMLMGTLLAVLASEQVGPGTFLS